MSDSDDKQLEKKKYEWPEYQRTGVIHGNYGSNQKWRDQRRAIMMEIINNDPTRHWSVRDLEDEMRKHPLIQKIQPKVGKSTIHRDWLYVKEELAEKRIELAGEYIDYHLNVTDYLLGDLLTEYQKIGEIDLDAIEDEDLKAQLLLNRLSDKQKLVTAIDKVMKRQSTLVPIEVPKKLEIEDNKKVTFYAEKFNAIREQVDAKFLPDIEEGDYQEIED